ncbi:MAG: tRNA (adenosine(37)-N6)-dimethylallyltransferase MiaA [Pseudomonadota bacterium]
MNPPAIFLTGPTASGKTRLAMQLYHHLPIELISVDSALVYRGMDIGTGKPTPTELAQVPHHLIDIRDIPETYSAAQFRQDALSCMTNITRRGHIPLLVGGTNLYFRALREGLSPLPAADPVLRAELQQRLQTHGLAALQAELAQVDPVTATRVQDSQRILRALEVWYKTKTPLSVLQMQQTSCMPYRLLTLICAPAQREALHQRIHQRFAHMLALGLEQEVAELMTRPELHSELPALRAVGYRQIWAWMAGNGSRSDMIARSEAATRQLAKRQLTWLRTDKTAYWLPETETVQLHRALSLIRRFSDG